MSTYVYSVYSVYVRDSMSSVYSVYMLFIVCDSVYSVYSVYMLSISYMLIQRSGAYVRFGFNFGIYIIHESRTRSLLL
jgi:hypothetical protein